MHRLVAIDLPGGEAFVAALVRAWDAGDAILPVDQRLPAPAREVLFEAARPHAVVGPGDPTVETPLSDGPPMGADDALAIATSGTTGAPKVLVHTHAAIRAHAEAVHRHLAVDPSTDRWLACLPLAHIGGLGVVLRSVVTGTPVDVTGGFDATMVAAAPDRLGTTLVSLVPTALDRVDPTRFRWIVLGGSADPGDRPSNVVRTYGLTETCGGVVYDGVPLPGTEVDVGPGGAIGLRGPWLARGRRGPDGTVTPVTDEDGWLRTGDIGTWRHGRLHVQGRADDLIVTGGENVWPAPVEAALGSHPKVRAVAVAGRPDPEWGSRVVALVEPADPSDPPTLDDLRAHVRATLPAYAAPKELVLVDALPRTALGKIRRPRFETGADEPRPGA